MSLTAAKIQRLAQRARIYREIRSYFESHGFLEVETPLRVAAAGTDVHLEPISAEGGFLITSPEFHMKRLLVAGLSNIFQICRASRADEQGHLHEPEFSLLEWYRSPCGYEQLMLDTELIVEHSVLCLAPASENGARRLSSPLALGVEIQRPFARITVKEAFKRYADIADASELAATDEDLYFELLVDKVEPALAQSKRPIFLHEYPLTQAALAQPCPGNSSYAERFELYCGPVELCNGYGELRDATTQRSRFMSDNRERKRRGLRELPIDENFLAALEQGLPVASGNALGLDRLVMLATGAACIADVIAFPSQA